MRKISDDELREIVANLGISQAKTEAMFAKSKVESDEQFTKSKAEYEARQAKADERVEFGNYQNNGALTLEDRFYRAIKQMIKQRTFIEIDHIKYDMADKDLKGRCGQLEGQYDMVLFNTQHILIIEVKKKAHISDIEKVLRLRKSFPKVFP